MRGAKGWTRTLEALKGLVFVCLFVFVCEKFGGNFDGVSARNCEVTRLTKGRGVSHYLVRGSPVAHWARRLIVIRLIDLCD